MPASTLILGFPACRTVRNKLLVFRVWIVLVTFHRCVKIPDKNRVYFGSVSQASVHSHLTPLFLAMVKQAITAG
jgi:hypothetical protein